MKGKSAPLVEALVDYARKGGCRFHVPGHKGSWVPRTAHRAIGARAYAIDVTELEEIGDPNAAARRGSALEKAEDLAAKAVGARCTRFLVGGSTRGIQAAILSACRRGDLVIVPRNSHYSVVSALVLSGATPIWAEPDAVPELGASGSVSPDLVSQLLAEHPRVSAVVLLEPNYYGLGGRREQIIDICHSKNVPVIVDQAHGAHFGWHPDLPSSAVSLGADLVVESPHKTLCSMTQTGLLHISEGSRIDLRRVDAALHCLESSSPSFVLLGSLDAMRDEMQARGRAALDRTLAVARELKERLGAVPGVRLFELRSPSGAIAYQDPSAWSCRSRA